MLALIILLQTVPAEPIDRGFFARRDVDFWGTRQLRAAPLPPPWADGPRPPGPVADLIDSPTPENARRYLDWQRDRLEKLQRALAALEEARLEAAPPDEILYFTRPDCAWCRRQDAVLRDLNLKVRRVGPDEPELWIRHGVTATPTIVVPGRAPVVGFRTRAQIQEALR